MLHRIGETSAGGIVRAASAAAVLGHAHELAAQPPEKGESGRLVEPSRAPESEAWVGDNHNVAILFSQHMVVNLEIKGHFWRFLWLDEIAVRGWIIVAEIATVKFATSGGTRS
jgi:hypothetical protein